MDKMSNKLSDHYNELAETKFDIYDYKSVLMLLWNRLETLSTLFLIKFSFWVTFFFEPI